MSYNSFLPNQFSYNNQAAWQMVSENYPGFDQLSAQEQMSLFDSIMSSDKQNQQIEQQDYGDSTDINQVNQDDMNKVYGQGEKFEFSLVGNKDITDEFGNIDKNKYNDAISEFTSKLYNEMIDSDASANFDSPVGIDYDTFFKYQVAFKNGVNPSELTDEDIEKFALHEIGLSTADELPTPYKDVLVEQYKIQSQALFNKVSSVYSEDGLISFAELKSFVKELDGVGQNSKFDGRINVVDVYGYLQQLNGSEEIPFNSSEEVPFNSSEETLNMADEFRNFKNQYNTQLINGITPATSEFNFVQDLSLYDENASNSSIYYDSVSRLSNDMAGRMDLNYDGKIEFNEYYNYEIASEFQNDASGLSDDDIAELAYQQTRSDELDANYTKEEISEINQNFSYVLYDYIDKLDGSIDNNITADNLSTFHQILDAGDSLDINDAQDGANFAYGTYSSCDNMTRDGKIDLNTASNIIGGIIGLNELQA